MNRSLAVIASLLAAWSLPCCPAAAQLLSVRDWPTERVELLDGRTYQGLIESEDQAWVNLIQIERRQGRPMHLVIRPIERSAIASLLRLKPSQREQLRLQIERFRSQARIERGHRDAIRLGLAEKDGIHYRTYRGKWFSLDSSADDPITRRVILRIEQIFTAYRQVLPPQREPSRPMRVVVLGSMTQYRKYLERLGLQIENPACFIEDGNLVVAGSELATFAAELAKVNADHDRLREELDRMEKRMAVKLAADARQLRESGTPAEQIKKLLLVKRAQFEREIKQIRDRLNRVDSVNARKFDAVTRAMFTRLNHEAFHAYLENHVYPNKEFSVPRWLNEGLAVIFEGGLLECDTLRVDAPNRVALGRLKADLGGQQPLSLKELLDADQQRFVVAHNGTSAEAARYYVYSWGLAYYLTFERRRLGTPAMDEYVRRKTEDAAPSERFEKLVEMPLDELEPQWREYILKLR